MNINNKIKNKNIIRCEWCNKTVSILSLDFYKNGIVFCSNKCEKKFKEMQLEAAIEYEEKNRISKEIARDNELSKEKYGD